MQANTLEKEILDWYMTSTDKGISSEAMAKAMLDKDATRGWSGCHPHDPDDFNRCLKLLRDCPTAKQYMHKVAAISETWKRLVNKWEELEQCFIDEVGLDWRKGRKLKASKTYDMMQQIIKED
jgi:hypothetical protein